MAMATGHQAKIRATKRHSKDHAMQCFSSKTKVETQPSKFPSSCLDCILTQKASKTTPRFHSVVFVAVWQQGGLDKLFCTR